MWESAHVRWIAGAWALLAAVGWAVDALVGWDNVGPLLVRRPGLASPLAPLREAADP